MNRAPTISVIGCGWLGLPLARRLIQKGWQVKGSTTNSEKQKKLQAEGIDPYLVTATTEKLILSDTDVLKSDICYINIPPRRRLGEVQKRYPKEMYMLLHKIPEHVRIIFISSTGVYPDKNQHQEVEIDPKPIKESGKAILEVEKMVQSRFSKWTILRMAGLVGPNREPGRWFSGKKNIPYGMNPVNMVHLEDAIEISLKLLNYKRADRQIYNICCEKHPTKSIFYATQSDKLGLVKPEFRPELGPFKTVDNEKIKTDLDYEFIYPDPLLF